MARKRAVHAGALLFLGPALVLLGALITPGAAGQSTGKPQESLQYQVSVTLKLLQVYVTDKSGKPVRDLAKDDFIVLDNGKPVSITEFERHELMKVPGATKAPSATESLDKTPAPARDLHRKFFIYFDFAFNNAKGLAAGVQAALSFLDSLVIPGDEAALVTYSAIRGLRIREYLTTDIAKVRAAVATVTAKEIAGRADEIEYEYWQLAGGSTPSSAVQYKQGLEPRQDARRLESKILAGNYLRGLTAMAKALRLVQGQKCILFFSTGIPTSMVYGASPPDNPREFDGASLGGARGSPASRMALPDPLLQPLQEEMLKEFSASSCAFYVFDTRESSKMVSLFGYDQRLFDVGLGGIFYAGGAGQNANDPFINDKTTGLDTLKRMSKQTGGQYYSNIALYEKSLADVQDTTAMFYVLGYPLSAAFDGQYHEIEVRSKRPGCRVRAQPGYFNPKPFREYSDIEKDIQLFDLALNRRSEFVAAEEFPATVLAYNAGEGMRLRAVSRMPREVLTGLGAGESEIVTLFFDGEGNVLSLQRAALDVSKRPADMIFTAGFAPEPGQVKCRVIVRNLETGRCAVGAAAAHVPVITATTGGARLALFTPLLMSEAGGLHHLDGAVKGKIDRTPWRDIYPYDEGRFSPVVGEAQIEANSAAPRLLAILPFSFSGTIEHNVFFSANLVDSGTGENIPVVLRPRDRIERGSYDVQIVEVAFDGVKAGRYVLYFNAGDKPTGATAHAHVPLVVKR